MDIRIYVGKHLHHLPWCNSFARGLRQHGIRPVMTTPGNEKPCDVAVFWSHKFTAAMDAAEQYICLENGYLGENRASAGWNGLNGRADFCNENVGSDRGDEYRHLLQPYHDGHYILVMGQCRGDSALGGIDLAGWVTDVVAELYEDEENALPVYLRPHPKDASFRVEGVDVLNSDLVTALEGAHWVITYNSSSGVDALLAGCAVSAFDPGSMVWDVAGKGLEFRRTRRGRWLDRLAYCQWSMDEMASGATWEHLRNH